MEITFLSFRLGYESKQDLFFHLCYHFQGVLQAQSLAEDGVEMVRDPGVELNYPIDMENYRFRKKLSVCLVDFPYVNLPSGRYCFWKGHEEFAGNLQTVAD